jgi:cephalosporin hydroxylase
MPKCENGKVNEASMTIRTIIAKVLSLPRSIAGTGYSLNHLRFFQDSEIGPIQKDEALFLYAIVKTVDPKTIVEFGFYQGHSAMNFLKAMSFDARLYSYDISEASMKVARKIHDKRFKFIFKSQTEFAPSDVDNRMIDLAFFDAAHDFQLNVATFEKLKGSLSARALIVVHDTGVWYGDLKGLKTPQGHFLNGSASSGYIHQPGERAFVNYIKENWKDFDQIHLHSTSKFRHGMTVLQRNAKPLPL